MPLNIPLLGTGLESAGSADWLGELVGLGRDIYRAWESEPSGGNGSIFDIPGVDLQWPVVTEQKAEAAACGVGITQAFRTTPAGNVVPREHIRCNPKTGDTQYFIPARPAGWKVSHVKGTVSKSRRRCGCASRGRSCRRKR